MTQIKPDSQVMEVTIVDFICFSNYIVFNMGGKQYQHDSSAKFGCVSDTSAI
jgi:very-short-patch-repair endonuclease